MALAMSVPFIDYSPPPVGLGTPMAQTGIASRSSSSATSPPYVGLGTPLAQTGLSSLDGYQGQLPPPRRQGQVDEMMASRTAWLQCTHVACAVSTRPQWSIRQQCARHSTPCPLVSCLSPGLCLYKEHQGEETRGRADGHRQPPGLISSSESLVSPLLLA